MLAKVKLGCTAFKLLHTHLLLVTKGMLAVLGEGDSTKVLGTDPSHLELIFSKFIDVIEKPVASLERVIKHEIYLLPDSVPPTKR